jgi:signal transduction histidine kinase
MGDRVRRGDRPAGNGEGGVGRVSDPGFPSRPALDATILIVDDQAANVSILEGVLAKAGYSRVHSTTSAAQTIWLYAELDPDLLLLDLHMPQMDGFEVLDALAKVVPAETYFPILVLTADANPEAKQRALGRGATDFLTKPFDVTEVLLRIRNLLHTRSLHLAAERRNEKLEEAVRHRTEELRRNFKVLRRSADERRLLLSRLLKAQEDERTRIAGDVHDDSVQVMSAVHIRLQLLRRRLSDPELIAALEPLEEAVRLSVRRLRHLLFDLHPPILDSEGLAAALRVYLDQNHTEDGPVYEIRNELDEEPPPQIRTVLYRIAGEALSNVRRHAKADRVAITLDRHDGAFRVRIDDDGVGFAVDERSAPRPGHLGLASMRERAELAGGTWRIESTPGTGTTVEFEVPSLRTQDAGTAGRTAGEDPLVASA